MRTRRDQRGRVLDRAPRARSDQRNLHNATKPSVSIALRTLKVAQAYAVGVGASGRVRGGTLAVVEMSNPRSMIGFVNRYASLAGKSCCCGRSWTSLDRSLAKRGDDAAEDSCEAPSFVADESLVAERDQDETTLVSSSSPSR
jgi:hypothetical protein